MFKIDSVFADSSLYVSVINCPAPNQCRTASSVSTILDQAARAARNLSVYWGMQLFLFMNCKKAKLKLYEVLAGLILAVYRHNHNNYICTEVQATNPLNDARMEHFSREMTIKGKQSTLEHYRSCIMHVCGRNMW